MDIGISGLLNPRECLPVVGAGWNSTGIVCAEPWGCRRCLWCLLPWMWDVRLGCLLSLLSFPLGIYRHLFLEVKTSPECMSPFMNFFFLTWFVFWNTDPGFCLTWEHFPLTLNIIISLTFISSHSCTKHTFLPSLPPSTLCALSPISSFLLEIKPRILQMPGKFSSTDLFPKS